MPIYEYQCEECGRRFEVLQKLGDPAGRHLRGMRRPVKRLVSAPAFQFKGSGWYVTDYAKKGSSEASSKAGEAKSDSGANDGGKSESKANEGKAGEGKAGEGKGGDAGGSAANKE